MRMHIVTLALWILLPDYCHAQETQPDPRKTVGKTPGFSWVNRFPEGRFPGLTHATFDSKRVRQRIGYCIYLPPCYDDSNNADLHYPVVYYLHGGRPGSECKSIALTNSIDEAIRSQAAPAMIYVFVNGGAVSHYNYPQYDSPAEDILVHELIPHIDATYRTIAGREGRGLEGFSQGGRATARIGFAYPELFCSAASGGGGHATEKRIAENDGWENETLRFQPGANSWDRARDYARASRC
jgi:endo-1,4-beta-xylanase